MVPYLDCPHPDQSGITLEYYESLRDIRFLEDGTTVKLHRHDFYEMVLILRGSCRHFYRSTYIPLMPGDLFLIPPNQPHSYRFHESVAIATASFTVRFWSMERSSLSPILNTPPSSRKRRRANALRISVPSGRIRTNGCRRGTLAILTARASFIWTARSRIIFFRCLSRFAGNRRSRISGLSALKKCCWKPC